VAAGTGSNNSSPDQRIRIWETKSGQLTAESEKLNTIIWEIRYSPDGSKLAAGLNNNSVQLRDASNLSLLSQLDFPGAVNSLAFSPDGKRLAAGVAAEGGGTIFIVDLDSGERILEFWAHAYSIPSLDFSPDGMLVASGAVDRYVKVWNSYTGGLVYTLSQDSQGNAIRFSPDGSLLASGHCEEFVEYDCLKGMVLIWSTSSWEVFRTLTGPLGRIEGVAFSPDLSLFIGTSDDGYINFWKLDEGSFFYQQKASFGHIDSVSLTSDGRYLATGSSRSMSIWQIQP
jgi:WD40 repeat protein